MGNPLISRKNQCLKIQPHRRRVILSFASHPNNQSRSYIRPNKNATTPFPPPSLLHHQQDSARTQGSDVGCGMKVICGWLLGGNPFRHKARAKESNQPNHVGNHGFGGPRLSKSQRREKRTGLCQLATGGSCPANQLTVLAYQLTSFASSLTDLNPRHVAHTSLAAQFKGSLRKKVESQHAPREVELPDPKNQPKEQRTWRSGPVLSRGGRTKTKEAEPEVGPRAAAA